MGVEDRILPTIDETHEVNQILSSRQDGRLVPYREFIDLVKTMRESRLGYEAMMVDLYENRNLDFEI